MSVRKEDRQNRNCPSRGLGIPSATISVGVGAAWYCYSKRPEKPHAEGSTSTWECEPTENLPEEKKLRAQAFRERSWSLEECSICFEVILNNQEVMSLPCTHQFHTECIMPWLQEKRTCPNCREAAE